MVCFIHGGFEQALIEDGCQIRECLVRVTDDNVDDGGLVPYLVELHGVIIQDGFNTPCVQSCCLVRKCRDNGGAGFCGALLVGSVLAAGEVEAFKHGKAFPVIIIRGFFGVLDGRVSAKRHEMGLARSGSDSLALIWPSIFMTVSCCAFPDPPCSAGRSAGFGRFIPEVAMVFGVRSCVGDDVDGKLTGFLPIIGIQHSYGQRIRGTCRRG